MSFLRRTPLRRFENAYILLRTGKYEQVHRLAAYTDQLESKLAAFKNPTLIYSLLRLKLQRFERKSVYHNPAVWRIGERS